MFVLDGSSSSRDDWSLMLRSVESAVNALPVGQNDVNIAIVVFAERAVTHAYFDQFYYRDEIIDVLRGLRNQ